MKKILRLTKEFFFALRFFKNPLAYYLERLRLSHNKKIILRLRSGLSYSVNANTNEIRIVNEIWNMKIYDPLLRNVRDGATVVDIGANIGVFSMKAARAAKNVKVFSYEPFPQSFTGLTENIRLNNLEKSIMPVNKAVAGRRGELELFFRPNDSGGVSMYQLGDKSELHSIKVPAVTLEDIFSDNKINTCDFMKIDCEGAEEEIFFNAPRDLFRHIKSITLEWHYSLNKMTTEEFCGFLRDLGYETKYDPPTFTLYAWRA